MEHEDIAVTEKENGACAIRFKAGGLSFGIDETQGHFLLLTAEISLDLDLLFPCFQLDSVLDDSFHRGGEFLRRQNNRAAVPVGIARTIERPLALRDGKILGKVDNFDAFRSQRFVEGSLRR
jgi:hypothetical protein